MFSNNPQSNNTSSCRPKTSDDREEFQAFLNKMPPEPYTLRVTGEVVVPDPGFNVELMPPVIELGQAEVEQDKTLVLELKKERLEDRGLTPVVSICPVEYRQSGSYLEKLDQVLILRPDQEPVTVPIQEIH